MAAAAHDTKNSTRPPATPRRRGSPSAATAAPPASPAPNVEPIDPVERAKLLKQCEAWMRALVSEFPSPDDLDLVMECLAQRDQLRPAENPATRIERLEGELDSVKEAAGIDDGGPGVIDASKRLVAQGLLLIREAKAIVSAHHDETDQTTFVEDEYSQVQPRKKKARA